MIEQLRVLPVFPLPEHPPDPTAWRLTIDGAVRNPVQLDLQSIQALPNEVLNAPFRCEDGWEVEHLRWRGIALARLLTDACPASGARFVAVHAGNFVAVLPLDDIRAQSALLAWELNRAPLPVEHGGPVRLVMAGAVCYESVKWVQRLELRITPGKATARHTALTRIGQATGSGPTPTEDRA